MFCSRCGAQHTDDALFCTHCGMQLHTQPVAPAPEDSIPEPEPMVVAVNNQGFSAFPPARSAQQQPWQDVFPPFPPPQSPRPPAEPAPVSSGKKGRHWPAILIMGILTALGLLLFFLLPYTPASQPEPESCFTVSDGLLSFHAEYYTGGSSLTVPEEVDGERVTGLAKSCFADCDMLQEIILPEGLTYIGEFAFAGCGSLRGIFIPEKVTYLGGGAFENCTQLEAVCVPASVGIIGTGAFGGCEKLRHVIYSGRYEAWKKLYSEYINGNVTVYASNGNFPHRG